MNEALMFFLKVNIAIALFYLFYRLAFYNDTFWSTRRFYLVVSILLSVVYPFISFSGWLEKQEPMQVIMANYVQLNEITVTNAPVNYLNFENVLLIIYGLVTITLLIRMIVQLTSILRWRLKGKRQILQGNEIIAIDAIITPFSFFNTIFINPALHNEQETHQILTHEFTHARQLHSLDVLLSELMTVIFWINPAAWLLKREIRHNLEFLADNSVLKSGIDSKNYQYHLLQLSYQVPENQLINKFNISPLKKRITMMNQQKTKKAGILKYSLIVPLALALVLSSNAETLVNKAKNVISQKEVVTEELTGTTNTDIASTANASIKNEVQIAQTPVDSLPQSSNQAIEKSENELIYSVIEKMPQFPGGEGELINYIGKNVKYPANAMSKGIQGKTLVRFVVNNLGKVEKAVVVRGLDPECDKEALRVISAMPQFIPGEQNGKKVSVYYTLPIVFSLNTDNSTSIPVKKPIIGIEYGDKNYNNSGVIPKVKEYDPKNPPVFVVDGKIQSRDFDVKSIKIETVEKIDIIKPDGKNNSELVSEYGKSAVFGVVKVTLKHKIN